MLKKVKSLFLAAAFMTTLIPNCAIAASSDAILDTNFNDNKISGWRLDVSGKSKGSIKVKNKELMVSLENKGVNKWDVALKHSITPLEIGGTYKVEFEVYSDKQESIYAKIGDCNDPFREYWNNNWSPIEINRYKKTISQTFTVTNSSDAEEMAFHLGGELKGIVPCRIYFDDIKITKLSSKNDVLKYNFNDNKIGSWKLDLAGDAKAFTFVRNGQLKTQVFSKGTNRWDIALKHAITPLEIDATYKVDFKLSAKKDTSVYAKIGDTAEPYKEYWNNNWSPIKLTANKPVSISQTFVVTGRSDQEEIAFHLGGDLCLSKICEISFDDISITKIPRIIPTPTSTTPPTPTPTPTNTPTQSTDILNCNFDNGDITGWNIDTNNGGEADYSIVGGALQVNVKAPGVEQWDVALTHKIPSLIAGTTYKVEFKIKALKDSKVYAKIGDVSEPYREVWNNNWIQINLPASQTVSIVQTFMPSVTCPDEHLAFFFGGRNANAETNDIVLDDIKISKVIATSTPTPTPTPTAPAGVINYNFNDGSKGEWILDTANGAAATYAVDNGEMKVQVNAAGEYKWDVALYHKLPAFKIGKVYDITFKMRASKDAKVFVKVGDIGEPFREIWNNSFNEYTLTADQNITVSSNFTPTYDSADQLVAFHIGGKLAGEVPYDLYFDDIQISEK